MIVLAVEDEGFELGGCGVQRGGEGGEGERAGEEEEARGEHGEDLRAPETRGIVKRFAAGWAQKRRGWMGLAWSAWGRAGRGFFRS